MPDRSPSGMYPTWMEERPTEGSGALPYRPPSELPLPAWFDAAKWPHFARPELVNAVYRCQHCGKCLTTDPCTSMLGGDGSEAYTPRARISVIRALLEERMRPEELSGKIIDAVNLCSYCNNCAEACMVNVAWVEGLAPEPNIPCADLFDALRQTLIDHQVKGVR